MEETKDRAHGHFRAMVESVGVKRFSQSLGLSTRQVNRILAGVQPNPVHRLIKALQASDSEVGDRTLDFIAKEMGGHFVRESGGLDDDAVNAVKECAEAIAAISDGHITELDEKEIREAISALICLNRTLSERRIDSPESASTIRVEVHAQRINLDGSPSHIADR